MGSVVPLFLLGYYGFGNWGDELSLLATLCALEDVAGELGCSFTYHVLSGKRGMPFPLPPRCHLVPRYAEGKILRALWESTFLVVGGGSLLQDVTSFRSLVYYAAFLAVAKGMRKKRIFFGCGLGPFRRAVSERIVRYLLRGSEIFLARDEETLRFLKHHGLCPVSLVADPVFLLWRGEEASPTSRFAIFLRKQALAHKGTLLVALRELQRRGVDLECVAFHRDEDWEVALLFGEELGVPARYFQSFEEVWTYFQTLGGVLSMRFHPLVLATCFGIPWCALHLDPKISSFSAHWRGRNLFAPSEITPDVVSSFLEQSSALREETLRLRGLFVGRARSGREELARAFRRVLG
ncbi:MAG: polysaccharide pyruvyl transferase family protein [Candidatus Caldatribacterium sp.]|uniref:polysaccharide pyruvyl transferase family protein n=1 Tax=Candidatus Caldatribacterium sp. TaxID=2282143 RepID=UPI0029989B77|nr:polysaccharide pyruvyl transferase family protein [Candidatus Caldatribacterium sp.]MCX7730180.1 polysaccharide pyruvyl transferase family protein [Candidatus Caldatribacterium sp.]MDW8081727.1 polysaccharide pyruvyl transferase family protein [Candidatus Calescibacterium sp.]